MLILILAGCTTDIQKTTTSLSLNEKVLEVAREQLGAPYIFGSRGPNSFDCSGLITYSYKKAYGRDKIFNVDSWITDDATIQDLYDWNVQLIPLSKINPGDIIFMTREKDKVTHGGLFIKWEEKYKKFKFIHASSLADEVTIDTWFINNMDRELRFVDAGRFEASYK